MRYYYKLFLWENGKKSEDLTKYLTMPIFIEDRLNEELDTGEVVLDLVPITKKAPYAPKTKMRIERYTKKDFSDTPKTWDFVVDHDDVEEYAGEPRICCHRISLIEPSVIAQNIHVDNIALTYELQDVTTNYKTYSSDSTKIVPNIQNGGYSQPIHIKNYDNEYITTGLDSIMETDATFSNSYAYIWDEESMTNFKNLSLNLEISNEHIIKFNIPELYCYGSSNGTTFDKKLFQMNTITTVYRYDTKFGEILPETKYEILSQEDGPKNLETVNDDYFYSNGTIAALRTIDTSDSSRLSYGTRFENYFSTTQNLSQVGDFSHLISFTTSTLSASEIENGKGYYYAIEIYIKPKNKNSLLNYYNTGYYFRQTQFGLIPRTERYFYPEQKELQDPQSVYVKADINCIDLSSSTEAGYLIMKGSKYSCYELIRKALLTIDTKLINNAEVGLDDIEYFIDIDPAWINRLKICKVQETILENKNLWEVFLQVGYYLHAIPLLNFASDGTDKFVLSFKQLGGTEKNEDDSRKITIFNSQNLSEYFSQYDSYVTNIFSPQNMVDEWLVCKTNDESALVSNNTAILKTTYGISEIVAFDITYDGSARGESGTKSALSHIFESSIYSVLTADYNISPSKGNSLYYELGGKEIQGLTYVPPSPNNDMPMSLKRIIGTLFSGVTINNLKFNSLKFHITYRTQDTLRVSQVRPDIENFMKNTSLENYPHHEQYYGQQDKIVDSERFSLNLFGKLVRVGNGIYQCQEMVENLKNEKISGQLVTISNEPYYVVSVEQEMYNDGIFQKITYSKNFNQLSQIVIIPSEPRFYEVSERTKIRREKREFDFFKISTEKRTNNNSPTFLNKDTWQDFIKKILFNKEQVVLPNYAWTRFKADVRREHRGSYGQYVAASQLFPSSELDRSNPNQVLPKDASDHADVIVPLLHFPIKDGIVFEWDMEDNFKAGDAIDTDIESVNVTVDEAYFALQSVRYCDILGRADLYSFRLFNKTDWTFEESQKLPKACIEPTEDVSVACVKSPFDLGLEKDGREELSFNYQISLLHRNENNAGDFVTFSNLFGSKTSELHCCALDGEVSMFDENTSVIAANVIADNISYEFVEDYANNVLEIKFTTPSGIDLTKIKSIVFYEIDNEQNKVTYLAKNFTTGIQEALPSFYIYPVFNEKEENYEQN